MVLKIFLSVLLAFFLWGMMFSAQVVGTIDFWVWMMISTGLLMAVTFFMQHMRLRTLLEFKWGYILQGIFSALLLYLIFWVSRHLLTFIFLFAERHIQSVYLIKQGYGSLYLSLMLLLWIGPAEELFWRGFVQEQLMRKMGLTRGYLLSALMYMLIHIWTMNIALLLAALVCGLFWGFFFMRERKLWPIIISHAVWDVLVFCIFPLTT